MKCSTKSSSLLSEFVSCDSCFIYVLEGNALVLRASKNPHPEVVDSLRVPLGRRHYRMGCPTSRAGRDRAGRRAGPSLSRFRGTAGRYLSLVPVDSRDLSRTCGERHQRAAQGAVSVHAARDQVDLDHRTSGWSGDRIGAHWRDEIAELSDKLAVRKIIERAKGIVQAEFGVSEEEAYSIIKKQARSRRKTMKEIGEAILLAEELKREQKTNASPAA